MNLKTTIRVLVSMACIVLLSLINVGPQNDIFQQLKAEAAVTQFTTNANPGFEIWEDPNRPDFYAYDFGVLSGSGTDRYWFHSDAYNEGIAFVRIGLNKPTTNPNTGEILNRKNLRLVEVRPRGHNAFQSYRVQINQNDVRVAIGIDGISFTETPFYTTQNDHNKGTWTSGAIYAEFHHIPLELVWEYKSNPPPFEGSPSCPVAPVNMVNSNDIKKSSLVHTICNAKGECTYFYDHLDVYIEELEPFNLKAGYGFEIKVKTEYYNEYYNNWPGARKVVAYFQKAEDGLPLEVELEPLYPTNTWDNEWVFPESFVEQYSGKIFMNPNDAGRDNLDTLIDGEKKWYTPFQHEDGAYNFKVVAYEAGNNNLKNAEGNYVAICGTPFDNYVRRSVIPDKPFLDSQIGYNWKDKEMVIGSLTGAYYNPNNNTGAASTYYLSTHTTKQIKDDQLKTLSKTETSSFFSSFNFN